MLTLELHKSDKPTTQPWYTIIRATNGKVLFWTEMYANRTDAINAGQILLNHGLNASFIDKAA